MILSTIFTSNSCDIFDQDEGSRVFENLKILKVTAGLKTEATTFPVQTRDPDDAVQLAIDLAATKRLLPITVSINAIAVDADTMLSAVRVFRDEDMHLRIQTKNFNLRYLTVTEIKAKSSSEVLSGFELEITMEQAFPPVFSDEIRADAAPDSHRLAVGRQPVVDTPLDLGSVVSKVFGDIGNAATR